MVAEKVIKIVIGMIVEMVIRMVVDVLCYFVSTVVGHGGDLISTECGW